MCILIRWNQKLLPVYLSSTILVNMASTDSSVVFIPETNRNDGAWDSFASSWDRWGAGLALVSVGGNYKYHLQKTLLPENKRQPNRLTKLTFASSEMLSLASRVHSRRASQFAQRRIINFSTTKIDPDKPFEEERLPWYNPDQFYPIPIGEILDASYKVLGKLGYGAYSTVWLCRNVRYYIISRTNYHSISCKKD